MSTALALLVAIALGVAYAMLRSDMRARQDRTARYCRDVIGAMYFYGEALRTDGLAEISDERLQSLEHEVAKRTLRNGYRYCLLIADAKPAEADQWALRLSLGMNTTSVDKTRQALHDAMGRLRSHGY